jgi:hypothetical protein
MCAAWFNGSIPSPEGERAREWAEQGSHASVLRALSPTLSPTGEGYPISPRNEMRRFFSAKVISAVT